jgi:predicted RNase H-like nuclease (RuvC/YqgF family)
MNPKKNQSIQRLFKSMSERLELERNIKNLELELQAIQHEKSELEHELARYQALLMVYDGCKT